MSEVVDLLPPILIGVGTLIPGLIKGSPFQIPKALRRLAAAIGCLLCWIAYFLVIGLGRHWHYDPMATILPSLIAAGLLTTILVWAWKKSDLLKMKWPYVVYLLCIWLLALAAGNWVGQRGVKIITFKSSESIKSIEVQLTGASNYLLITPANMPANRKEWVWLLGPEDTRIDNVESLRVNDVSLLEKSDLSRLYSGFPASRFEVNIKAVNTQ